MSNLIPTNGIFEDVDKTGPDYPAIRIAGRIGSFEIGASEIGKAPFLDFQKTIISQYANSPIICELIERFANAFDYSITIDDFFDNFFNPKTAIGYGLDIWGGIVNIGRILTLPATDYFGFAGSGASSFNNAPFYNGAVATNNYTLSDDVYRRVIFAKAAANISDCSIPSINKILRILFPNRGNCYVIDGPRLESYFGFAGNLNATGFNSAPFYNSGALNHMTMNYVFTFPLNKTDLAIIQSGVLPKPAGVLSSIIAPNV